MKVVRVVNMASGGEGGESGASGGFSGNAANEGGEGGEGVMFDTWIRCGTLCLHARGLYGEFGVSVLEEVVLTFLWHSSFCPHLPGNHAWMVRYIY